jgi:FkbM family methyltransferase
MAVDAVLEMLPGSRSPRLVAQLGAATRLEVDTRVLEQKFAFYYGEWERELLAAAARHFERGCFYDVGGSIGLYAVVFGKRCLGQDAFVRTFEPLPANVTRLSRNLALNGLGPSAVRVHEVALSDRPGPVRIALAADGIPGNAKVVSNGGVEVDVTTLDRFWDRHGRESVGFLKVDTEGFDTLILRGARELIRTCRPNLLVEFNRERMQALGLEINESWHLLVEDLGYQAFRVNRDSREYPILDPGTSENLLFVNHQDGPPGR